MPKKAQKTAPTSLRIGVGLFTACALEFDGFFLFDLDEVFFLAPDAVLRELPEVFAIFSEFLSENEREDYRK
jgi:hypothetical protein